MPRKLRLILGDQLNEYHPWYSQPDPEVIYLLMELKQETGYVRHHIQKVTAFFLAMRHFAKLLKKKGHKVIYLELDHAENRQDLVLNIKEIMIRESISYFGYQLPDEYRLDVQLKDFCNSGGFVHEVVDTAHFLTSRDFLAKFFEGKKTFLMESFYREMRKKFNILLDGKEPLGGKWNYDQENRSKLKDPLLIKDPKFIRKDVKSIVEMLRKMEVETIGEIDENQFSWPTSREECLQTLEYFCEELLPYFGQYQDAMFSGSAFLFHSRLSFGMNTKLLSPLEVVQKVERHWYANQESIGIAQVEGFIRQIIGWREYMRGIYWAKMPAFASMNFFGHERSLPSYYWTGKTKMNCMRMSIGQSLQHAYAHHIQRLMVTGNFALLAGIHPDEIDEWYLGIYIDAIQWVEITNVRGMSQFADGGIVGTKPYVSSANYIDKMSDYCGSCYYKKNLKVGEKSCPFNSLYWHFYHVNEEKLAKNPRIGMAYITWSKMKDRQQILDQAQYYLDHIEEL
jgi:deoxyribodipyrimidine photolyase-related protein